LLDNPELRAILIDHARLGARVQAVLRFALVVFFGAAIASLPPSGLGGELAVVVGYAAWSGLVARLVQRGGERVLRLAWIALYVDLAVLASLTGMADAAGETSTAAVLRTGFFVIPLLAATQLRPKIAAFVMVPAVLGYLASGLWTGTDTPYGLRSLWLETALLAVTGIGCVGLSRVQRSRVRTIGGLAQLRTQLLDDLVAIESRERRTLAEHLHDGALQYVLAARFDLADARDHHDELAFDRLAVALDESSRLLRSTVTELHPAVLADAGLVKALEALARSAAERAGLALELELTGWSGERTSADELLYSAARELLANVVKHARASKVQLRLERDGARATLTVTDDGAGIAREAMERSTAEGHIGIASHRVRIEAAGGTMSLQSRAPQGTAAAVTLPLSDYSSSP
jgi:two-component system NarL family sensor kinase